MLRRIEGYHRDEEGHWVAHLDCGHQQHVRHDPPLVTRPWVLTAEGRRGRLGAELDCVRCDEAGRAVARAVRDACVAAARDAWEDGGERGLCLEGRWDLAIDGLRALDLDDLVRRALTSRASSNASPDGEAGGGAPG